MTGPVQDNQELRIKLEQVRIRTKLEERFIIFSPFGFRAVIEQADDNARLRIPRGSEDKKKRRNTSTRLDVRCR